MKHPHAELMALYAEDALHTDKPYLTWQVQKKREGDWINLTQHPTWSIDDLYRTRKVTWGMYCFTQPISKKDAQKLKKGLIYFTVDLSRPELINNYIWQGSDSDFNRVEQNVVHLTENSAYNHASALQTLNKRLLNGNI